MSRNGHLVLNASEYKAIERIALFILHFNKVAFPGISAITSSHYSYKIVVHTRADFLMQAPT
jgi:hypothetical protein